MHFLQQILFILLFSTAVGLFTRNIRRIRKNILLGRDIPLSGSRWQRLSGVILYALGQKKMFRNWIPALLHFFVYAGFIIINIEILEIILDGLLGTHRLFAPWMGRLYFWLIGSFEVLAVLVIAACVLFLIRRNVIRIQRFHQPEMGSWPRSDANYILIMEIALMLLFLGMNTADQALQVQSSAPFHPVGRFWISACLAPWFNSWTAGHLELMERVCWWLHITGILFFLNYLPYSKHLHILLAFPNTYYRNLEAPGAMSAMPEVTREVQLMLDPGAATAQQAPAVQHFGARDVKDLSWKNLLDAYSCTECGRCTSSCPANLSGKKLSPRKILMDTRDRLESFGDQIRQHPSEEPQGPCLLDGYISREELWACTTCNACVQECPVSISPLDIILQLRRYLVMEQSQAPAALNAMFANLETNQAPWKFSPDDRDGWISSG